MRTKHLIPLLAIPFLAAGCTLIGVIADKAGGGPKVPAEYKPQKDITLVLVESYQNPASASITSEQLDRQIAAILVENKVVPVVNPDRLSVLRHGDPTRFKQLDIAGMGRNFGAAQVIYVNLVDLSVDPVAGSELVKGKAEARVKVVDSKTGHTLWPQESKAGYPLSIQTPYGAPQSAVDGTMREQVSRSLADQVAKLFFEHEVEDAKQELQLNVGS